jgi:hypothetical protein
MERLLSGEAPTEAASVVTKEALHSQSSEYFFVNNALLGVLRASAVRHTEA